MRTALALLLAAFVAGASAAAAGTIAIQISHRAELVDGELRVTVTTENQGDEAAHAVTPLLRFRGAEVRGETQEKLPPTQPSEVTLALPAGPLGEGHWPYELVVEYADANLYPFQALSIGLVAVGSPPLPKVAVPALTSPPLADEIQLPVVVKNLSETERRVALTVSAPEAIERKLAGGETVLGPWAEVKVPVTLINRAALAGSRYPLFVIIEYEDGAVHQTVVAQTSVEIRDKSAAAAGGRSPWVVGAVVAALAVGFLLFRAGKR